MFQNVAYRSTVYRTGTISKTANIRKRLTLNENGLKWTSNQRCLRAADAWDEYCYNLNENKQRAKFFDHRN